PHPPHPPSFPTRRSSDLERERSIWQRLHIDPPLLAALVMVLGFGLMVLYSATDGSREEMSRRVAFIGLALVVMFTMAQIPVSFLDRKSTRLNSSHVKISY